MFLSATCLYTAKVFTTAFQLQVFGIILHFFEDRKNGLFHDQVNQ